MSEEEEYVGISSAGVEYVEVHLPEKTPWGFFQQLAHDRPELDERLVFWHFFVNKHRRENGKAEKTIRETAYDIFEHVLNDWVCVEEEEKSEL